MLDISSVSAPPQVEITQPLRGARPAETNGWDLVSVVKIADMNEAIAAAGTTPEGFDEEITGGTRIAAHFDPWRVGTGGDGHLINLEVPLRDLTLEHGEMRVHIPAATAAVRVELEMIPSGLMRAGPDGTAEETQLLVIRTRPSRMLMAADPAARPAKLLEIDNMDGLRIAQRAAIKLGLEGWLNENLTAFAHVFATVNIVRTTQEDAKGKAFSWMKPTEVSYAFGRNAANPEDSVLAILCQTGGRSAKGLIHQAQADMIPAGANAAFTVSKSRVLRDMIAPGLEMAYDGLKQKHLAFAPHDTGLKLSKPVQLRGVKGEDGKTYDPVLEVLRIGLRDTELVVDSRTATRVAPGVHSVSTAAAHYNFGLTKNSKGEKTLGFSGPPVKPVNETRKDRAVDIIDAILTAIQVVAVVVGAVMTGGAILIGAGVAAAALAGQLTIKAVSDSTRNDGPPIDLLVANATSAVTWSSGARFDPTFAALNGGLQVGGFLGQGVKQGLLGADGFAQRFQRPFKGLMAKRVM